MLQSQVSLDDKHADGRIVRALLAALESGIQAVGLFDDADRLVYSNEVFRKGWAISDPSGATFDSMIRHCYASQRGAVISTVDINAWLANARRSRHQSGPERSFEVDLWDGRWMWVTERRLSDGWILFVAQDITALKISERTLRLSRDAAVHASLTDPLTGLPNRRSAMEFLDSCASRASSFYIAIADIDNFKQINDRHGHQAGDEVLVLLSADLRSLQGQGYFVARLAGDEFLIVGPGDEPPMAFETNLQGLLRTRIEHCAVCEPRLAFAISIGAARFPCSASNVKDLLAAADHTMYRAKSQGRSTLRFAT